MKKFVLFFGVIALMAGTVMGQGAAPAPPSPYSTSGTSIVNTFRPTQFQFRPYNVVGDTTSILEFYKFGGIKWLRPSVTSGSIIGNWYLGANGQTWDIIYGDTFYVSTGGGLRIGGYHYTRLDGVGLDASNNQLDVNLTDLVPTGWIIDSTILPRDISPTDSFTFLAAYRDTVLADSEYVTKNYVDNNVNTFVVGNNPANNQFLKYNSGTNQVEWDDAPGAAGGDNIAIDTADSVIGLTDPVFKGAILVSSDTITILGGDGRFGAATDSTFNVLNSTIDSLKRVDVDTVRVDNRIVFRGATGTTAKIDSVYEITGQTNSAMFVSPQGTGVLAFNYGQANGLGTRFYDNTTQSFSVDNNAITGNGSSTISGLASLTTTAATIAGQVLDGTEDIVSEAELTTTLTPYVRTTNENWQDVSSGTSAGVRHTSNGINVDVLATTNQTDTTYIATNLGSLVLQSGTTSNDAVILRGPSGGVTSFGSTVNHLGQSIDSVGNLDANYGTFDNAMRLMSGTTYYTEWQAPAGQTQNYVFTSPLGYGTNGQVLATNGAGGTSWTSAGAGGGVPIYVNDGSTEYSPDEPLLTEGSGIAMTVSLNGGAGGKDSIALAASGLTASNFATDADIATEAEVGDTATAFGLTRDEWHNRQGSTTYGNFAGSDSVWMLDAAGSGSRMLTLRRTHTGGDTTHIIQDGGDGLVIGNDDANNVTILDADTTRLNPTATMVFTATGKTLKATTFDSLVNGMPTWYTLSAGAGDISAVGSMTGGDAFAGAGADEDWLGMGASAGRIQFEADGATGGTDDIEVLDGNLVIGARRDNGKHGLLISNEFGSSGQDLGAWVEQTDSANGYDVRWDLVTRSNAAGTTGGDPSFSFGSYDAGLVRSTFFNVGLDRSDAFRFKIVKSDAHGLSTTGDYFIMDTLGKTAITGGLYLDDGSMTADSLAATMGFVKKRLPFYQTATDISWNYPTAAADTSHHATFPYTDVRDTTILTKASTSTGNDTLFGLVIPFFIEDSTTIDSLILFTKMSSATADSAKIDSVHMTYETADAITVVALTSYTTDIGGTTNLTRTAIPLSRTALPGDIIRVRPAIALKQDDATCIIYKAQIKGSKR